MFSPPTSRPRVLATPTFRGTAHYLIRLPGTPDVEHIRRLIAGNQLSVDDRGLQVATLVRDGQDADSIVHTADDLPNLGFLHRDKEGREIAPRILFVGEQSALVWGQTEFDHRPGIWLIHPRFLARIRDLDVLSAFFESPHGEVLSGTSHTNPGQVILFNRMGSWSVQPDARVTVLQDGSMLILESFGGVTYAYRVTRAGIMADYRMAPVGPDERAIQLLRWRGRYILAGRSQEGSWLREFGAPANESSCEHNLIHGDLEAAWNSPNEQSIALLTRMRQPQGNVRRLYLNGTLLREDTFTMEHRDLRWSPNGRSMAAVIRSGADGAHQGKQVIVTPTIVQEVREVSEVKDLLVDDKGEITAMILTDGIFDRPIVGQRPHDPVPYAWNLHQEGDTVVYNSIHGSFVMRWVDETDAKR